MNAFIDDSCLEPAELGAFIDGTLPEERVAIVTRHVSRCAACRALVEDAAEIEQVLAEPPEPRRRWDLRWVAVAAALGTVIAGLVFFRTPAPQRRADPIERLAAAFPSSARTLEPRLSGGFRWAPLRALRRTPDTEKTPEELVASGVAGSVLREIGGDRTPRALHAAGVAYLVAGDAAAAVPLLNEAARKAPGDARIWSDFSAALYSAAKPDDHAALQRTLDAANRAIHANPALVEAYFNRALVLERIGGAGQAAAAWNDYLQRDRAGDWAAEARAHKVLANSERE